MSLRPNMQASPISRIAINVGACLDIPTGTWVEGKHGESLLLGGLMKITGVVGQGNSYKTSFANYLILSAASRMGSMSDIFINTYDTELSFTYDRAKLLLSGFDTFKDKDLFSDNTWLITDKSLYSGNDWWASAKQYLNEKSKSKASVVTPFLGKDKNPISSVNFSFGCVDSLTEFETSDVSDIINDSDLGDSDRNVVFMRQGLVKAGFMAELPRICELSNNYMVMVSHVGKEIQVASRPFAPGPDKKLQFLKQGYKIKGAGDKIHFSTNHLWYITAARPLINQNTKKEEYPKDSNSDNFESDLLIITVLQLRSKTGPSGYSVDLVVSQTEGVQPTLSEFHFLRTNQRYGMSGNDRSYSLDLYPSVTITRPTIRGLIDKDPRLCRAINITSELSQMHMYHTRYGDLLCSPKELYEDLTKQGYKMEELLDTRGWWCPNNDKHPVPFLSTMDLLRMRKGLYKPYWLKKK